MSTEINTRGMVRLKAPGFPAWNDAECLSKLEILSEFTKVNGNYDENECPLIDDITAEIPQGFSFGYLDPSGNAVPFMKLIDGGSYDAAQLAGIVGDNISIIILKGFYDHYNNSYADAAELLANAYLKIEQIKTKIPANSDGIHGSQIFTPARKIGAGIFYIGTPLPAKVILSYTFIIEISGTLSNGAFIYPLSFTYSIEKKS